MRPFCYRCLNRDFSSYHRILLDLESAISLNNSSDVLWRTLEVTLYPSSGYNAMCDFGLQKSQRSRPTDLLDAVKWWGVGVYLLGTSLWQGQRYSTEEGRTSPITTR